MTVSNSPFAGVKGMRRPCDQPPPSRVGSGDLNSGLNAFIVGALLNHLSQEVAILNVLPLELHTVPPAGISIY